MLTVSQVPSSLQLQKRFVDLGTGLRMYLYVLCFVEKESGIYFLGFSFGLQLCDRDVCKSLLSFEFEFAVRIMLNCKGMN